MTQEIFQTLPLKWSHQVAHEEVHQGGTVIKTLSDGIGQYLGVVTDVIPEELRDLFRADRWLD